MTLNRSHRMPYITTRGFIPLKSNMNPTYNHPRSGINSVSGDLQLQEGYIDNQSTNLSPALSMTFSDAERLTSDSITYCTTPGPSEAGSDISLAVLLGHDEPLHWLSSSEESLGINESSLALTEENGLYMTIYYEDDEEDPGLIGLTAKHTFVPVDHPYGLCRELYVQRPQKNVVNYKMLLPRPELADGGEIVNFRPVIKSLRRLLPFERAERLIESTYKELAERVAEEHRKGGPVSRIEVKVTVEEKTTTVKNLTDDSFYLSNSLAIPIFDY